MEQLFKNVNINGEICDILCRDIKIEKIGKIDGEGIDFKGKRAYADWWIYILTAWAV